VRKAVSAHRLRDLREARGYSQRQLAEILGVRQATIANWEVGASFPQIRLLPKLADLYGVSIVYLRTGQNEVHDHRRIDG